MSFRLLRIWCVFMHMYGEGQKGNLLAEVNLVNSGLNKVKAFV